MVDVGYCIDGRHGVIRNVSLTANPYSDHRVFTSANCKEQYCMKVDDIEYIIPSDIDSVSGKIVFDKDGVTEYGADGSVVMKGRYIEDKPITFAEKFKEVFGYEPDKDIYICDVMNCIYNKDDCQGCPYRNNNWDAPYVKAEVED